MRLAPRVKTTHAATTGISFMIRASVVIEEQALRNGVYKWQERRIVSDATLHEATKTANRYKRRKDVRSVVVHVIEGEHKWKQTFKARFR